MEKKRPENLSDEMLVFAAILGDLRSFDALALRYRAAAYRVAQSIGGCELAEDAVQEALLLAFKALPAIEEPAKFASWLYAITRHVALRMSRRSHQERSHRVDVDGEVAIAQGETVTARKTQAGEGGLVQSSQTENQCMKDRRTIWNENKN
jgi:RNA polymerase sigma-70 factor (ECF subfamily)